MGNLVFQATLGGQVNLVGPNTASTFNLNVPAVSSTISTTSGTETLTNKTLTTPVINGFTGDTSVVNIGSNQFYKDTSGNIGVGVTPSAWSVLTPALQLGTAGSFVVGQGSTDALYAGTNAYFDGTNWKYKTSTIATVYTQNAGTHSWSYAGAGTAGNTVTFTQAMTLDSSGNLLVGATSTAGGHTLSKDQTLGVQVLTIVKSNQTTQQNNNYYVQFNGVSSAEGYIQTNGSAVLSLVDVSDARLKTEVVNATYGLETIQALRPVEFKWHNNDSVVKGFIAQEVKSVLPESVMVKDESENGGFEDMHYLETQTMIPVLVKAIQELKAEFDAYKASHP